VVMGRVMVSQAAKPKTMNEKKADARFMGGDG
jgi:hypothetical protein